MSLFRDHFEGESVDNRTTLVSTKVEEGQQRKAITIVGAVYIHFSRIQG